MFRYIIISLYKREGWLNINPLHYALNEYKLEREIKIFRISILISLFSVLVCYLFSFLSYFFRYLCIVNLLLSLILITSRETTKIRLNQLKLSKLIEEKLSYVIEVKKKKWLN